MTYNIKINGIEFEIDNPINIDGNDLFYVDLTGISGEKFTLYHQRTVLKKLYLQPTEKQE